MRAQLEFDNLRASASPEEALRFAKEHRVAADASGVIGARAWARINEAAALSVTARIPEAITLLREVEAFPGIGKTYARDSPFAEKEARYFVVRVSRQRALRITYRFLGDDLVVLYLFPATYPLTQNFHQDGVLSASLSPASSRRSSSSRGCWTVAVLMAR